MKRITTLLLALSLSALAENADPEVDKAAAISLQEVIQQWIETENLSSLELSDWQADQARMQQLLSLHRAELAQLDELLSQAGESSRNADQEREQIKQEISDLRKVRSEFIEALTGYQKRAIALSEKFPEPLQQTASDPIQALQGLNPSDNPREVTQALIGLITAADEFNAAISNFTEIREVNGARQEVKTLYLGLAQAFYASSDGRSAGIGRPGPDGWQWQERPDLAKPILRALAVATKDQRPDFVKLPLQVQP